MTKHDTEIYEPNINSFERYTRVVKNLPKGAAPATTHKSHEGEAVSELKKLLTKADRAVTKEGFGRHDKTLISVSVPTKDKRIAPSVLEELYRHFGVSRSNVVTTGTFMDSPYDGKNKTDRLDRIDGNRFEKDGISWEWDHTGEITRVETQTDQGISIVEEWRKMPKGGLPTGDTLPVNTDRVEHTISFRRQPTEAIGSLAVEGPLPDPHDY